MSFQDSETLFAVGAVDTARFLRTEGGAVCGGGAEGVGGVTLTRGFARVFVGAGRGFLVRRSPSPEKDGAAFGIGGPHPRRELLGG